MHSTCGMNYNDGRKLAWMPMRCAQAVKSSDSLDPAPGLKARQEQPVDAAENCSEATYAEAMRDGSVHKKDASMQNKGMVNTHVASSSASQKADSVNTRTNSVTRKRNRDSGAYTSCSPTDFGTSTQHVNPSARGNQKFRAGRMPDQRLKQTESQVDSAPFLPFLFGPCGL